MSRPWIVGGLAWAAAYAGLALADPPDGTAVAVAQFVVPPLLVGLAVLLATPRATGPDRPERLLGAATRTLPGSRHDWGEAMTAELAEVEGGADRWRFALGGARAALWLSLARRRTAIAVLAAAVAAVAAAGTVHAVMPGLALFAGLFAGLVTVVLAATVKRPVAPRPPVSAVVVLVGVVAAVAVTAWYLRGEPAGMQELTPKRSAFLALCLAACLGLAVRFRGGLLTGFAALLVAGGFLLSARLGGPAVTPLLALPVAAFAVPAFLVTRASGSVRSGVHATVLTVVAAAPLTYAGYLPQVARRYVFDGPTLDGVLVRPGNVTLAEALVLCLGVLPLLALAVGALGAGLAARVTSRRSAVL